jgi:hypothetical protein
MNLYKGFSVLVVCGGKDNNTILFALAGPTTVTETCDWWLSSRSNIDLSFLTVIRSVKSSMNNRRSSSVFHPDLLRRGYGNITVFKVLAIRLTQRIDLRSMSSVPMNEGEEVKERFHMWLLNSSNIFMVMKYKKKWDSRYHYSSCSLSLLKRKQLSSFNCLVNSHRSDLNVVWWRLIVTSKMNYRSVLYETYFSSLQVSVAS